MVTGHNGATAFEETVSAVTATNSVELGERRWVNGEQYLYVHNDGAEAATGRALIATLTTGYSADVATVSGSISYVGHVKHATFPAAGYGWLLVQGQVAAQTSTQTAQSATDGIGLGDAGALATNAAADSASVGIWPMSAVVADASGAVCNCFVKSIWA